MATSTETQTNNKNQDSTKDQEDLARAASLIQRNYRTHSRKREAQGLTLSADRRWGDALQQAKVNQAGDQSKQGTKTGAEDRWKRGGVLVGQLAGGQDGVGKGNADKSSQKGAPVEGGPSLDVDNNANEGMIGNVPGATDGEKIDNVKPITKKKTPMRLLEYSLRGQEAQELSKVMEAQYWLEMVDKYHRYGSNLKPYHAYWSNDESIKDNFFKWLDEGAGKELDLPECPRERLEKERITYLSAEQRANYVVDIKDGKLVWRRNGKFVDTTKGKHKDLGNGRGIVELGPEEQAEEEAAKKEKLARKGKSLSDVETSSSSESSSDEDSEEEREQEEAAHHYGGDQSSKKKHMGLMSSKGWQDALLRKTVRPNTWIYVLNARHELYVGIKQTGKFQHSSFMFGARVLSAGLLKVDNGTLTSLSGLSGHYRGSSAHFRYFVSQLQEGGVDLSKVRLSKSLLLLVGMEKYAQFKAGGKTKRKEKEEKRKVKLTTVDKVKEKVGAGNTTSSQQGDNKENKDEKKDGLLTRMMEKLNPSKDEEKKDTQPCTTPEAAPALK